MSKQNLNLKVIPCGPEAVVIYSVKIANGATKCTLYWFGRRHMNSISRAQAIMAIDLEERRSNLRNWNFSEVVLEEGKKSLEFRDLQVEFQNLKRTAMPVVNSISKPIKDCFGMVPDVPAIMEDIKRTAPSAMHIISHFVLHEGRFYPATNSSA